MNAFRRLAHTTVVVLLLALCIPAIATISGLISLHHIQTGSMEPLLSPGDLAIAIPTELQRLVVGDVVALENDAVGGLVAHRIVEFDEKAMTARLQGDANNAVDPQIYDLAAAKETPRVIGSVPHVGAAAEALWGSLLARLATLGVVTLVVLLWAFAPRRSEREALRAVREQADEPVPTPV